MKSGHDQFFGFFGGGMTYFTHKSGPPRGAPTVHGLYEGEARVEREGYSTDLFADRAIDVVRRADPKPFFLSLHFNAPHWPWEGGIRVPAIVVWPRGADGDRWAACHGAMV